MNGRTGTPAGGALRVLLAEDQALVRDGLRLLLELHGLEVVAVEDGRQAVEAARNPAGDPFDVAVLDVRMPVLDGIGCVRALREEFPRLPILMLTTYDDDHLVRECLSAGADAYLLKDIEAEDLANAVRLVAAGGGLIPGDLARRIEVGREEPLTPRQREVLALIAQGLSNREIADRLHLSEGTVKNVVSEIYARLDVRDRVQAVLRAQRLLGPVDDRGDGRRGEGSGDGEDDAGGSKR